MAIQGFFHPGGEITAAPFVFALVDFRRLGLRETILFLVDTGSNTTCVHSDDIIRLGIDYRQLDNESLIQSSGVGGNAGYYSEPATLALRDDSGDLRLYDLDIHISQSPNTLGTVSLPSLLGRDFLNRCRVYLDSASDAVQLEPRNVVGNQILP